MIFSSTSSVELFSGAFSVSFFVSVEVFFVSATVSTVSAGRASAFFLFALPVTAMSTAVAARMAVSEMRSMRFCFLVELAY